VGGRNWLLKNSYLSEKIKRINELAKMALAAMASIIIDINVAMKAGQPGEKYQQWRLWRQCRNKAYNGWRNGSIISNESVMAASSVAAAS